MASRLARSAVSMWHELNKIQLEKWLTSWNRRNQTATITHSSSPSHHHTNSLTESISVERSRGSKEDRSNHHRCSTRQLISVKDSNSFSWYWCFSMGNQQWTLRDERRISRCFLLVDSLLRYFQIWRSNVQGLVGHHSSKVQGYSQHCKSWSCWSRQDKNRRCQAVEQCCRDH